jgi:hypothetical protein
MFSSFLFVQSGRVRSGENLATLGVAAGFSPPWSLLTG